MQGLVKIASRDQSTPICIQQKSLSFNQSNVFTLLVLRAENCTKHFMFVSYCFFIEKNVTGKIAQNLSIAHNF